MKAQEDMKRHKKTECGIKTHCSKIGENLISHYLDGLMNRVTAAVTEGMEGQV